MNHPGLGLLASLHKGELDSDVYLRANPTRRATLRWVHNGCAKNSVLILPEILKTSDLLARLSRYLGVSELWRSTDHTDRQT